jgi:cytochrome c oxidase cbb3-type subunit 1
MNDYRYDNQTVQGFILSAIFWGVVGILVGLLISVQLWAPAANFAPYLTYGRLRPVHTNGLAFGLGVGVVFGLTYYIVMRLCGRPLVFPKLARVQLWIFNVAIAAAAVSLMMGYTQSNEYAELEWPLDIGVVILWVMFAVNVFATIIATSRCTCRSGTSSPPSSPSPSSTSSTTSRSRPGG